MAKSNANVLWERSLDAKRTSLRDNLGIHISIEYIDEDIGYSANTTDMTTNTILVEYGITGLHYYKVLEKAIDNYEEIKDV